MANENTLKEGISIDVKSIDDLKYIPYPTLRNALCQVFHNIDKILNDGYSGEVYIKCELDISGELRIASNHRELIFDIVSMLTPCKLRKYDKLSFANTWNSYSDLKNYSFSLAKYVIKEASLDLCEKLENESCYLYGGIIPCTVMQIIQEEGETLDKSVFVIYPIKDNQ